MAHDVADSEHTRAVATAFLRQRPLVVAPLLAVMLACLGASGAPRRQLVGFAIMALGFLAWFLRERRVGAGRTVTSTALRRSLTATLLGISIGIAMTGGLASPLVPMLFAPVGVAFAAFGRSRTSTDLGVLLGVVVLALLGLTRVVAPFALAEPWRRVALAAAVLDCAVLLYVGITSLASAHARAAAALALAGDQIARAAEARTREIETLGDRVAHEVKNPLAAIRALVELMLESGDERARKRLGVAAAEIARIEQILERSFSHPLASTKKEPADVGAIVHALAVVLEARAAQAGVELTARTSGELRANVDRDRINEAILNLLLNALEAARGAVTVDVARMDGSVLVTVHDDGAGMPAETLARIGTPYFTTKERGTGLGVSIARRTAEQHGGALDFTSSTDDGTTATLRIAS